MDILTTKEVISHGIKYVISYPAILLIEVSIVIMFRFFRVRIKMHPPFEFAAMSFETTESF